MQKRLIALLVITPLLLSSQLPTSYAAAKAGATCSKAGRVSSNFPHSTISYIYFFLT